MSGPAFIASLPVEGGGPLYTPTCDAHEKPWHGPASFIHEAAATNVTTHNTDAHKAEDDQLDLEPHNLGLQEPS